MCSNVYEPPSHLRDGGGCTLVGRNTLLKKIYMFIWTIPRHGPHRRIGSQGGGHTGGSDPLGRATSQDQILRGGHTEGSASSWISRRIRIYIRNGFRLWIRGLQKISCQYPFKIYISLFTVSTGIFWWAFCGCSNRQRAGLRYTCPGFESSP